MRRADAARAPRRIADSRVAARDANLTHPSARSRYRSEMDAEKGLLGAGISLLALSALCGFLQHRAREHAEAFARWRVVHAGGTAGAVQLLALSAVWKHFGQGPTVSLLAAGLIAATLAFFFGPLARALA